MALVVLDAGHGGENPGAVYEGRREKDDTLSIALGVGEILEKNGVDVYYTRTADVYEAPAKKAQEANRVRPDFFVSIHRNSSPYPNQYSGIESLVYKKGGSAEKLAKNINEELVKAGFLNQGIQENQNLAVLRRTTMPAVLVEVGFINTNRDNQLLDERFDEVISAIAEGILKSL